MRKSFLSVAVLAFALAASAEPLVKDGQKVAFLGDSITDLGNQPPAGYLHLVKDGLARSGVKVEVIPAGVPGDTSAKMLARLDAVLKKKPDWLLLSCGVNDAYPGGPVTLDLFKRNVAAIVDQARAAGAHALIMTTTTRNEDLNSDLNKRIEPYNQFLRQFAQERKLPLADNDKRFRSELQRRAGAKGLQLTIDGCHMNGVGNQLLATSVLEALGVAPEDIPKYRRDWNKLKSMSVDINKYTDFVMSVDESALLDRQAAKEGTTAKALAIRQIREYIEKLKQQRE